MQVAEGEAEVVGTTEDEEEQDDEDSVVVHLRVLHMGTTALVVEVLRHIEALLRPVEVLHGGRTGRRATFITHHAGAEMATSAHFDTIDSLTHRLGYAQCVLPTQTEVVKICAQS